MSNEDFKRIKNKDGQDVGISVKPLGDNIVMRVIPDHERYKGKIQLLEDEKKVQDQRAEVLAVGPVRYDHRRGVIPPDVKPGDVILYRTAGMVPMRQGRFDAWVIPGNSVVCVLKEHTIIE